MKKTIKKHVLLPASVAISLSLSACSADDLNAGMGIMSSLFKGYSITNEQLASEAKLSAKAIDAQSKIASKKNKYTRRLNKLTKNLKHYNGLNFNYKVYISKDVNAFAMPDGTIRVYSGLMDLMNDNEIISVIGHEIGHVSHKHSLNQYKKLYVSKAIQQGLSAYGGDAIGALSNSYGDIGLQFVNAQFSQKDELESDFFGINLLHKLGKDPYAAVSAQKKLQSISKGSKGLFSSHPPSAIRIQKMIEAANSIAGKNKKL